MNLERLPSNQAAACPALTLHTYCWHCTDWIVQCFSFTLLLLFLMSLRLTSVTFAVRMCLLFHIKMDGG